MYKKVPTDMRFSEREKEILQFWKDNKIFEKSVSWREGCEPYTFYDGPPTANGKPHIGHVLTRSIKDIIPRYRSMKGYDVLRKAGWDTHGLPVELEVEKLLHLDGKEQIEGYGLEPFIAKCKESVWKYKGEWEQMSDRVGYWADMENPYVTYDDDYIESVWWALKTIFDKGLLYKGHKIVPYCPRCGTSLASHEVAQGYKDVEETSAIAKFFLKDGSKTALLAWTTTPWTLPSNVALCVNENETYVKAQLDGNVYILAEALVPSVLTEKAEILERFKGASLVGLEYEPLFELPTNFGNRKGYRVVADDYVTLTDGTGIVHIAPAFGEDDNRVGRKWELPLLQFVDASGHMCGGTPWDGDFVKDADKRILEDLKTSGKLLSTPTFTHNYPFCWRCDTPLIYYARESWYVKMTAVKDKLMAFNRSVHWIPDTIKEGRMGNFIENLIDWALSRERFWGTPLPIWVCECGHVHAIGSKEELRRMSRNCPEDIELHKPFVDEVEVECPVCKKLMKREPYVIDCWFDSGSMPFAQWHYPFENKEEFERRYPANFISEAIDQTRGWFYTLMAIATCLFDKAPFENCVVLGLVCDKDGKKMSKHIGNVVDPWDVLNKQGADAVRWYFYTGSMPWLPSRFSMDSVSEYQRKFMGTLWNTYAFYILYADIDSFHPTGHELKRENLSVMDRWVLSRLNSLVRSVDNNLELLKITEAGRELSRFVEDLSNWYVRRCRDRYWGSEMTPDKEAAYMTLFTVLRTLTLICAPFVPFMSESIYQNLVRSVDKVAPESVHLCDFPRWDESLIDAELEANMGRVLDIVTLGRSARNTAAMKVRQPLSMMYVQGEALPAAYADIVTEELNIKALQFVSDASELVCYRVKPQLKTLGPRYGKLLPKINELFRTDPDIGNAIVRAHSAGNAYSFELDQTEITLNESDVLVSVEQREGLVSESDNNLTVVIDCNLTPELIDEGMVRELVSKLQTMRKEAGFEVADHIAIGYCATEHIADIFARFEADIAADTLADSVSPELSGYRKEWNINGEQVTLSVQKR
ncbi:MAG: isoleucine--tRNA ligase [Clostridia bacterium]|nr:isoleucine--tRNA ligase [Clostridia bacterium]